MRLSKSQESLVAYAIGIIFIFGFVAAVAAVSALVVMWAWNTLLPPIFGLPEIGFWQGLALTILLTAIGKGAEVTTRDRGR